MDNGTKGCHLLQGIKSTDLEAAFNVVGAQLEYCCALLRPNDQEEEPDCTICPNYKNQNQPVRPKVVAFTGKIECKKYPKTVWNSMTKEQQMQVCKLCKQQGIKPTAKQASTDARTAAIEAKLRITSQLKDSDVKKKEGRLQKNQHGRETEGILW